MNEINFNLEDIEKIDLSMGMGIKKIYPPIENLTVEPTKEQQVFNHENSYGYDNVTVQPIPEEYIIPEGMLPITENTTYDVRKYARVSASVHPAPNLQDKEVTPTKEVQNITSDESYDGLNQVTVNAIPNEYIVPSGSLDITENGIKDVTSYAEVNVNIEGKEDLTEELTTQDTKLTTQETTVNDIVEALKGKASSGSAKLQEKSITITQNGTQNIVADDGYDGLSGVEVVTVVAGSGSSSEIYSTEETMTNRKWINNKPIYRKVFTATLPSSIKEGTYSTTSIDVTNLNVETPTDISGLVKTSNGKEYWNINSYNNTSSTNDSICCYLAGSGNTLAITTNASVYASATANIIFEYTKV